jgi:hypothetical protein
VRLTQEEFELLVFLVRHHKVLIAPHTRVNTQGGSRKVRQVDFLRVLGQLRKRLSSVEGCSHYIRIEPWVVCQFASQPGRNSSTQISFSPKELDRFPLRVLMNR